MTTFIPRLNAAERKIFAERAAAAKAADKRKNRYHNLGSQPTCREPALGTLAERLDNIIRRQGGTTSPIKVGDAERRWLEAAGWAYPA